MRAALPAPREFTASVDDSVRAHVALYEEALRAGPPDARVVSERERVWQHSEDAWGRELAKKSAQELGFT